MRLKKHYALFVQVRDERYNKCYRSDDVCLLEVPCPRPLCDVLGLCSSVPSMLFLLSGDVESNPGPDVAHIMAQLQEIAKDVKVIKEGRLQWTH